MASLDLDTSRVSRAQSVASRIEEDVVQRGLLAGERLGTKDELRTRYGVAVATVNEALRVLEARGVVEARPGPGGGVFVAAPSSRVRLNHLLLGFRAKDAPFTDCLAVRNALEPLLCSDAAEHCRAPGGRVLRTTVDRMEEQADDPREFLRLNWILHRKLASMCANAPLRSLYLTLLDFVEDGLQDVRPAAQFDGRENAAIHRELAEAVIARDQDRVARAVERHSPMAQRWAA